MKAIWKGKVIADSNDTVIVETNHYFPRESVKDEYLTESQSQSTCVWKGEANYFNVVVDGEVNEDAAWYYKEPTEAAKEIKGHVAFWREVEIVE